MSWAVVRPAGGSGAICMPSTQRGPRASRSRKRPSVRVVGVGDGFGLGDIAPVQQPSSDWSKVHMPCFAAALMAVLSPSICPFWIRVGDIGRQQHDFHRGHQMVRPGTSRCPPPPQVERQVHEQLAVRILGKEVQHPLHGLVGVVGVQGGHRWPDSA